MAVTLAGVPSEPRYLLMCRQTSGGLDEPHEWFAFPVEGIGRALTREQAEDAAEHRVPPNELLDAPGPRFLLPLTAEYEPLAADPPMKLATDPGRTIWAYGDLARADMVAILRAAAADPIPGGSTPSPDRDMFPVSANAVVERARQRFGPCDAHEIQVRFDRLTMDVGGGRHGDADFYQVPHGVLGFR